MISRLLHPSHGQTRGHKQATVTAPQQLLTVGLDRRIAWHELLCTREFVGDVGDERAEHALFSTAVMLMLTLCMFVTCPFYVAEGRGRDTAVREAARK